MHCTGQAHADVFVDSFNGRLRDERLNEHFFGKLPAAGQIVEAWRTVHNDRRPHASLGGLTPTEFAIRPARSTRRQSPVMNEAK